MTVENRLEILERELCRANRYNSRLLSLVVLVLGLAVVEWMIRPQRLLAQNATSTLNEVRANRFVLERFSFGPSALVH